MNPIESHLLLILGKGLVLSAAFLALALVLLRGRSAHVVSLYWRSALAGLMIAPVVSLLLPWWNIAMPEQESRSVVSTSPAPPEMLAPARPDAVVVVPLAEESADVFTASPIPEAGAPVAVIDTPVRGAWRPTLLLGLWALGAVFVFGRWAMSWARVRRLVKSGADVGSPMWEQELARFSEGAPRVRLVMAEGVKSPMVSGLWRSVLLLPPGAESWDGEKRRAVLAHELCHVRRRDALFLLLARVVVAMHWINPLAWLAAKRLRLAEERTADDAVLADGRDPAEYAGLLAGFARRGVGLPVVAPSMASASTVRARVQRILDARQRRGAPRWMTRFGFGLLVCTVVLIGGGISFGPAAAEENPAKPAAGDPGPAEGEGQVLEAGAMTLFKAKQIIVPIIDFDESTIEEAMDFLRLRSRELDRFEQDPEKKGFNFVVIGAETSQRVIPRLKLRNVPLASVLEFICEQTDTIYEAGPFAITIKDAKGAEPGSAPGVKRLPPAEAFMVAKIRKIIVPAVDFEEASLSEALDFLRQRSRELDGVEPDPAKKGLNIVVRGKEIGDRKIKSMKLVNVPLNTVLTYVCELTNTAYKVNEFGITIVDTTNQSASDLLTRTFVVPPSFPDELQNDVHGGAVADPFAADGRPRVKVRPILELLRDRGIDFSAGASVSYVPQTSRLIVRARQQNLDLVAQLINEMMRDLPSLIKLRIELYDVPKAEALKIAKHNADRNDGIEAYRMVEALVVQKKAKLLSTPTTMVRPGQRGTLQSGSELEYVAAYLEKDGADAPVMRKALVGSNITIEPNIGMDGKIMDIRYELTMTRGEPKVTRRTIKAPVSGREVEVESVLIDTLTLKQGLTTMAGQTQLLGMMQSSMHVDNPNEVMVFLTATVTKVMPSGSGPLTPAP